MRDMVMKVDTYSTDSARDDDRAEEEAHTDLEVVALVVHGCQVDDARYHAGFEGAEEESQHDELRVGLDEAHGHVHYAPAEHKAG